MAVFDGLGFEVVCIDLVCSTDGSRNPSSLRRKESVSTVEVDIKKLPEPIYTLLGMSYIHDQSPLARRLRRLPIHRTLLRHLSPHLDPTTAEPIAPLPTRLARAARTLMRPRLSLHLHVNRAQPKVPVLGIERHLGRLGPSGPRLGGRGCVQVRRERVAAGVAVVAIRGEQPGEDVADQGTQVG